MRDPSFDPSFSNPLETFRGRRPACRSHSARNHWTNAFREVPSAPSGLGAMPCGALGFAAYECMRGESTPDTAPRIVLLRSGCYGVESVSHEEWVERIRPLGARLDDSVATSNLLRSTTLLEA